MHVDIFQLFPISEYQMYFPQVQVFFFCFVQGVPNLNQALRWLLYCISKVWIQMLRQKTGLCYRSKLGQLLDRLINTFIYTVK